MSVQLTEGSSMPQAVLEPPTPAALAALTGMRPVPTATIRTRVSVPLRFADGYATTAEVVSECLTGDILGSERCDCGPQLREAVERIAEVGGSLLYLRQETS